MATDPRQPGVALDPDAALPAGPVGTARCQPGGGASGRKLDGHGAKQGCLTGAGHGQSPGGITPTGARSQQGRCRAHLGCGPKSTQTGHPAGDSSDVSTGACTNKTNSASTITRSTRSQNTPIDQPLGPRGNANSVSSKCGRNSATAIPFSTANGN